MNILYLLNHFFGDIFTLSRRSLKLLDKFAYLGSSVSSTENDINTWLRIHDRPLIYSRSYGSQNNQIKKVQLFSPAAVVSILLCGYTTWTLINGYWKKALRQVHKNAAICIEQSWRQHTTKQQLYGYLQLIWKTIQIRRARLDGHSWRSKSELISDVLVWTASHGRARVERPARTYLWQPCTNTECHKEYLQIAMDNRDEGRERIREVRSNESLKM